MNHLQVEELVSDGIRLNDACGAVAKSHGRRKRELYQYAVDLRSMTQGRATYARELSHYDPVPKEIEAKVVAESKEEKEK